MAEQLVNLKIFIKILANFGIFNIYGLGQKPLISKLLTRLNTKKLKFLI